MIKKDDELLTASGERLFALATPYAYVFLSSVLKTLLTIPGLVPLLKALDCKNYSNEMG